jgi:regulator of nucleoside diphosphate kinase
MTPGDRSSGGRGHERKAQQRPPIVLTPTDRDKLLALIREVPVSAHARSAEFLRAEVERADVATGDISPTLVVRMGSDVKFIDHEDQRIHRARLVFPEEARGPRFISVLSPVGSALIGLGPGQSIRWTELGGERSLTVLEVSGDACIPSPHRRRG